MISENLGRVQGVSIFVSSAVSEDTVDISTLEINSIRPLVGDSILFSDGEIRRIIAVENDTITCSERVATVKGQPGEQGEKGEKGNDGISPTFTFSNGTLTITSA